MHILRSIKEFNKWRQSLSPQAIVGFTPTMGALHKGHMALIEECVKANTHSVVSIFVNQKQFNDNGDFANYPRPLEQDLDICRGLGVSAALVPEHNDMYPPGFTSYCDVEGLGLYLCGASRPGHFRGVCTVVLKLLNIVQPQFAYFGQKDFQQAHILKTMAGDFNLGLELVIMPTVRERSGLAMSSRNKRLTPAHLDAAPVIYKALTMAREQFLAGEQDAKVLINTARITIQQSGPDSIDYIEVVSQTGLQPVTTVTRPAVLAAAVFYGDVRLIDNILLE